jgi:excisionase family DNA binding protein
MEPEYYSVEEFAKLMNMRPITVRRAIRSGRITALRIGAAKKSPFRIPRHQIDKLTLLTQQELGVQNEMV